MPVDNLHTYPDRLNNKNISYFHYFKPWENTVLVKNSCTSNTYDFQQVLIQTDKTPINHEAIAQALAKKNVLRQVKTIQISNNNCLYL